MWQSLTMPSPYVDPIFLTDVEAPSEHVRTAKVHFNDLNMVRFCCFTADTQLSTLHYFAADWYGPVYVEGMYWRIGMVLIPAAYDDGA